MALPNTEHLINSVRLTIICLNGNDHILLGKLLLALNSDSNVCASIINLDERVTSVKTDATLKNGKFTTYTSCINDLITFAEQSNVHLLATVQVDKYSDWRSMHFKIIEELKDKVCFVRFVQNKDITDIRLQIESGENAWHYISYRLDDDGHITETQ